MSNREAGAALATFSLVLGLLAFFCSGIPAIPAVILGHIALGHIGSAETNEARGRAWFGLIAGYLNIGLYGLLFVLMAIGFAVGPQDDVEPVVESGASTEQTASEQAPPDQPAPPLPAAATGATQDDDVYLVEGDGRYHTFFCRAINDAQAQRTRLADATQAGFRACNICRPNVR